MIMSSWTVCCCIAESTANKSTAWNLQERREMAFKLRRLPHQDLQGLSSLHFSELCVQLQPADGLSGVVTTSAQVKQLKLHRCHLLDGVKGLAAALVLLPKLQHLSLVHNYQPMPITSLPSNALPALQQLTYLETAGKVFQVCLLVLPFCNWVACCFLHSDPAGKV
jgi:hypothetical protein